MAAPFDSSGIERDEHGVAHYTDRPDSLLALLRTSVERDPDHAALVEIGGPTVSYQELWDRSARVAGGLRAQGIERGDRVANRLGNGVDWVFAFFGGLMAGAVVVPVNTRFAEAEVEYVVDDSGAKFTFEPGADLPDGEPYVVDGLAPDDLAAIFYTSGTTGFPKGAMTSHENFLANSETAIRVIGVDRDEGPGVSTLVSVPLFHVTGCNSQLIVLLEVGGTVEILTNPLDLQGFMTAVGEHGVNMLVSVPAIYHAVISSDAFSSLDVSNVRWVSYGGAPIAPSLVKRIQEAFPNARVGNGFGLTESASILTFLPHEDAADHADSVGYAAPPVDLKVDDPDPETGVGELLARGPNIVQGYWNKAEATEETFADRWLRTGDLARMDDEGRVYIVDRAKDMINRGGENVYSIEVEAALAGAPGVGEAAVVPVPDDMMGEKVGAVIVPAAGAEPDTEAIIAHVRDRIADFKVPQYLAYRDEPLPRNPGGKVLKGELKEKTEWGDPLR